MKNLKRALSLALAMVMLVGMMVIPTSAVSNFADESEITYTEAVEVTSGIGLFAGSDGKFMPQGTVTRAQMATIIVKMLNGSDANADAFKGAAGGFNDTLAFEGGWAEGYINWCASLGVVAGYGDGTFKPGQAVTTAEAVTMILNALKVDAGQGQWPLTVMAKAEELKLFEDMSPKPDTNKALTREELAVIALHGLEYSPEGKSGYTVNGVTYDSYMEAYYAAGQNPANVQTGKSDSLAQKVFELSEISGYIVGNQATGLDFTQISNGVTTFDFDIETGLEDIGHYATVYYSEQYKSEREPGLTYTIFDESTVVVVDEAVTGSAAKFRAAFGGSSVKLYDELSCLVSNTYVPTVSVGQLSITYDNVQFSAAQFTAPAGTYIMDGNTVMAYIAPITTFASRVVSVDNYEGEETVELDGVLNPISNSTDADMIDEYAGIKMDDYVTYTVAQSRYILNKVSVVSGKVTATSKDDDNRDVITMNGKDYVAFTGVNDTNLDTNVANINYVDTFQLYVTADGKFIGFDTEGITLDKDDTVYLLGTIPTTEKDAYGSQVITYKARGVNLKGNEVLIPLVQVKDTNKNGVADNGEDVIGDYTGAEAAALTEGFYSVKNCLDSKGRSIGLKALTGFASNDQTADFYTTKYALNGTGGSSFSGLGTYEAGQVYPSGSTTFIVLDGELNQSTPLEARVTAGSFNMVTAAEHMATNGVPGPKAPVALCTLSNQGANQLQVLVVKAAMETAVDSEFVYVTAENCTPSTRTEAGYTYDVLEAKTGAEKQITMDVASLSRPGFYSVYYNQNDELYELVTIQTLDANLPAGYIPYCASQGKEQAGDALKDGSFDYNVFYGAEYLYTEGQYMMTQNPAIGRMKYGSPVIIDVRTEDEIEASRISKITSLERIASLKGSKPDLAIYIDIWYACKTEQIPVIYVVGTEYRYVPSNGEVVYMPAGHAGTSVGSYVSNVVWAKSDNYAVGAKDAIFYNRGAGAAANTPGFFVASKDGGVTSMTAVGGRQDALAQALPANTVVVGGPANSDTVAEINARIAAGYEVTADVAVVDGVTYVYVTNRIYKVPAGAVLYSTGKFNAKATSGEFIVLDNGGDTSLKAGLRYSFTFDGTELVRSDLANPEFGLFCYGYKTAQMTDTQLFRSNRAGFRNMASKYVATDGVTLASMGANLYTRHFGYHKVLDSVVDGGDGTYTLNLSPRGCAAAQHGVMGACHDRDWSNVQSAVTVNANTLIVDARATMNKALTVTEFNALVAEAGDGELIVDFVSTTAKGTELKYLVITVQSPLS